MKQFIIILVLLTLNFHPVKLFCTLIGISLDKFQTISCIAQDPQFSQFYATPLYLNPAFTGNTIQERIIANYRNQWPGIPEAFNSYSFSYDHKFSENNSSLGIQVIRDKIGTGGLKFTNIGGLYSYFVRLSEKYFLRSGVRLSYTWRALDYDKLTFADQLIRGNGVSTIENFNSQRKSYLDIASGLIFHSDKYWIGVAVNHLNRPNQSLTGIKSRLPIKTSVHGGMNFSLKKNAKGTTTIMMSVAANYKTQQDWDQLDIGTYLRFDPLIFGLWYRGIPLLKSYQPGYANNDAVIILLAYRVASLRLKVGYSYDITISKLSSNTGGSHEISLIYEYVPPDWKKRRNFAVPCASF